MNAWPKKCPCCDRVFAGPDNWKCLALCGYTGSRDASGIWSVLELRHCICASTICIEVALPMALTVEADCFAVSGELPRTERPEDHAVRCALPYQHAGECVPWPF